MAVLRVARGHAAPLTEILEFLQREIVAGQVEQGIEEHRTVAGAEDKPVAVGPVGVSRTETQVSAPERQRGSCHAHWQARMSRIGGLHSVQGQHSNSVDHIFFQFRVE